MPKKVTEDEFFRFIAILLAEAEDVLWMKACAKSCPFRGIPNSRQMRHELAPFSPEYNLQIPLAIELDRHLPPDEA
jgi:hypothetical protein